MLAMMQLLYFMLRSWLPHAPLLLWKVPRTDTIKILGHADSYVQGFLLVLPEVQSR